MENSQFSDIKGKILSRIMKKINGRLNDYTITYSSNTNSGSLLSLLKLQRFSVLYLCSVLLKLDLVCTISELSVPAADHFSQHSHKPTAVYERC